GPDVLTDDDRLVLYGLYKQATSGNNSARRPPFYNAAARSKWQAWDSWRGVSESDARGMYVRKVRSI
ncbi:acyl-CoA binding protein, partial [Ramicandelaber brevisporus]